MSDRVHPLPSLEQRMMMFVLSWTQRGRRRLRCWAFQKAGVMSALFAATYPIDGGVDHRRQLPVR